MARAVKSDWPVGHIIFVPPVWRGDSLWTDIQMEAQARIGADLRAMYADLLDQPLSPELLQFVREIETRLEVLPRNG